MKTEKLTRLLSAIGNPANQNQEVQKNEEQSKQAALKNVDAVSVKLSQEANASQAEEAQHKAKLDRIKNQVANGTYEVDSKKVAASFAVELGLVN